VVKELHSAVGNCPPPIPTAKLISFIEARLKKSERDSFKINLICKNWQTNRTSGLLLRYKNHADVLYSATLNVCNSRFVVAKELSHLLLDTENKHFTKDPIALVQGLVTQVLNLKPEHDLVSENVALYCAIEILLPWHLRPLMNQMMNEGKSDFDIAVHFRAPENIVNLMLRSPYAKISAEANSAGAPPPPE
jgi:Zn-dependent peptidase ImmA (M78 family)